MLLVWGCGDRKRPRDVRVVTFRGLQHNPGWVAFRLVEHFFTDQIGPIFKIGPISVILAGLLCRR